jgi:ribulose-phosphate 3-epimerase
LDVFRNLFTHPPRLPLIAPSILSADFGHMAADCLTVLPPPKADSGFGVISRRIKPEPTHADLLHVDIMDGHFVPNLTFGPDMVKGLRRALPHAFLDVHLMVTDPWLHAQAFVKAGADHITFHVEVVPPEEIGPLAQRIRELTSPQGAVSVGLAINPPTPVERIMPHLEPFELILVMSVNPGFGGQSFIPDVLEKVRTISPELTPNQRLEMDGGVALGTVGACLDAGCDVVVAGSAVFGLPPTQRGGMIEKLRGRGSVQ